MSEHIVKVTGMIANGQTWTASAYRFPYESRTATRTEWELDDMHRSHQDNVNVVTTRWKLEGVHYEFER